MAEAIEPPGSEAARPSPGWYPESGMQERPVALHVVPNSGEIG
jgi:hypothetical protein